MSPMSVESTRSLWRNRELKRSRLYAIGVLLLSLMLSLRSASALSHIVVSTTLPAGSVAQPYNANIGISGGSAPFHFAVNGGTLPPGLTLTASTGTISGTPTSTGSYSFHVDVSGGGGTAHGDHWVAIKVLKSAISLTISPSSANVSSAASQQFTAYITGTSNTAVSWSASKGT
ncbi:MAG TPA: Ig domain-containing protein, partial [Terriglobales bacterium]|nr:Ig domain-containing protein [Terriglobales bacterium]